MKNIVRLTKKRIPEIGQVLHDANGSVTRAAAALLVKRGTLAKFIHDNPPLQVALAEVREERTDLAEDGLQTAIERGESWAIQFHLKTIGKQRGYVERQEQTGPDGSPIRYEVVEKEWQQEQSKSNGHTNANVSLLHLRRNGKSSEQDDAAGKQSA